MNTISFYVLCVGYTDDAGKDDAGLESSVSIREEQVRESACVTF